MNYTPKNWAQFQHYKDRSPPWIKLHKGLLDDWEYQCLPVASRAIAPMLWLLASDHVNGEFDATPKKLAFRLRMTEREVTEALKPLIEGGFLISMQDDSAVLAPCKPDAMPEERRDRVEKETEAIPQWLDSETWKAYCKHRGSKFTDNAKTLTIKKLEQFKAAGHGPKEILETSIANGWKGIFEPKAKGFTPVAQSVDFAAQRAKADIERTRQMLDQKLGPQLKVMP